MDQMPKYLIFLFIGVKMAYQISSSIIAVDATSISKTVQLPPASTVVGKMFLILDINGGSAFNPINITTTGIDTIDYQNAAFTISGSNDAVRLIAQNTSNYSILMRSFNTFWPPF